MDDIIGRHMGRLARAQFIEAPNVETVNQQVRTSMSVPFQRHMLGNRIATGTDVESPVVESVNQQVRTSMSVPYAPHMKGHGAAPSVDTVNQQVRTSMSVPFNPYMLGAHAEELLKRRIMISPVLSVWQFKVKSNEAFAAWLATREILMSEGRLGGDAEIRGVRYGGTYRVGADRTGAGGSYKTVWGYTSESAMLTMQKLCSDSSLSASIVQLDLIDFVKGLKKFIAEAGDKNFSEEILVSAAAG